MSHEKLVRMANQIAAFFETQPGDTAAQGVAAHINDFWEPRMRREFLGIVEAAGAGLKPLVLQAAPMIRRPAVDAG